MNKVIYHGGCPDGWCAAWIAAKALDIGEENLIRASYGDKPPLDQLTEEDEVWLVDFSYPRKQLLELASHVARVVVLDHHKTAEAELEDLHTTSGIEVFFDMNRSGARLAFDKLLRPRADLNNDVTLNVLQTADFISRYVQDRDLWRWELPVSREISAFLSSLKFTIADWDTLLHTSVVDLELGGHAILEHTQRKLEALSHQSNWYLAKEPAWKVQLAVTNICRAAPGSELLGMLAEGLGFAAGWYQSGDGLYHYSLRSSEGGIDVGVYAQRLRDNGGALSGGGHARAAGFVSHYHPSSYWTRV